MADARAAMRYHRLVACNANDTSPTWARDICREVHESLLAQWVGRIRTLSRFFARCAKCLIR
jgi:hypothetical protein